MLLRYGPEVRENTPVPISRKSQLPPAQAVHSLAPVSTLQRMGAVAACLVCAGWLAFGSQTAIGIEAPAGVVTRSGDRSIVLHWNRSPETNIAGYRVYRAAVRQGPYTPQGESMLISPSFADVRVTNNATNYYQVTALAQGGEESAPSAPVAIAARPFTDNNEFIDYVQQTAFDYFWYEANPRNGLVPDRTRATSPCSIAAVGFGLTAIGIGIDRGWITREQGRERTLTTLRTFVEGPQGPDASQVIGYRGWFYHFLDMQTALRFTQFSTELSSIDTALLLAGVIYAKQYFDGADPEEAAIRQAAIELANRVDWNWMAQGTDVLSMGWFPQAGFLNAKWVGYNEASILYILGLGAATNALPDTAWQSWTRGYTWATHYGQSYVPFPPLFGHQYSQCWLDLRHTADDYMRQKGSTYFENSRRATLAQRSYAIANPLKHVGYGGNIWGFTACDGPSGYAARGAPPPLNDDGTVAPTALGGSVPFAPEYCITALRYIYDRFRPDLWGGYGFKDAFHLGQDWWATDFLGIDQGPIVVMIENFRSQRVWQLFMRDEQVQRGLVRAGFKPLTFVAPRISAYPEQSQVTLSWDTEINRVAQVEYSPNLESWFASPSGRVTATNQVAEWTDLGPPATSTKPFTEPSRFYRVYQFSSP